MNSKTRRFISVLAALLVVCGLVLTSVGQTQAQDKKLKFIIVAHGGPGNPFWVTVIKGMNDAAKIFGVDAQWLSPNNDDVPGMAKYLEGFGPPMDGFDQVPLGEIAVALPAGSLDPPRYDRGNRLRVPGSRGRALGHDGIPVCESRYAPTRSPALPISAECECQGRSRISCRRQRARFRG
jgi:hypothetical protein